MMDAYSDFAVAIMLVLGLWQVLAGILAVVGGGLSVTPPGYTYSFSVPGWGSPLSMIANFLIIPFYPIWS